MMKYIISILFCSLSLLSRSQINSIEYYIDLDPGLGNATAFPIISGDTVEVVSSIEVSSLLDGLHYLNIRAQNSQGLWTQFVPQPFIVSEGEVSNPQVTTVEYYIDTDPGLGNGIAFNVNSNDTLSIMEVVDVGSLLNGLHYLNIRAENSQGLWTQFVPQLFLVSDKEAIFAIDQLAYSVDSLFKNPADATILNVVVRDSAVDESFLLELDTFSIGDHRLYVWARNVKGEWSLAKFSDFVIVEPLSVSEDVLKHQISVYPTFSTNKVTVNSAENLKVYLLDIKGKIRLTYDVQAESGIDLDLGTLESGIYFVNYKLNGKRYYHKILKE